MPELYMLIGLPGSGKTTWRDKFIKNQYHDDFISEIKVVSSDDFIEYYASEIKKSYADAFKEAAKDGTLYAEAQFKHAMDWKLDVIIDRTNLTPKSRKKWLEKVENYRKIAIVFDIPDNAREQRNNSRGEGRVIPEHVIQSMKETYIAPSKEEGFDEIRFIYS